VAKWKVIKLCRLFGDCKTFYYSVRAVPCITGEEKAMVIHFSQLMVAKPGTVKKQKDKKKTLIDKKTYKNKLRRTKNTKPNKRPVGALCLLFCASCLK